MHYDSRQQDISAPRSEQIAREATGYADARIATRALLGALRKIKNAQDSTNIDGLIQAIDQHSDFMTHAVNPSTGDTLLHRLVHRGDPELLAEILPRARAVLDRKFSDSAEAMPTWIQWFSVANRAGQSPVHTLLRLEPSVERGERNRLQRCFAVFYEHVPAAFEYALNYLYEKESAETTSHNEPSRQTLLNNVSSPEALTFLQLIYPEARWESDLQAARAPEQLADMVSKEKLRPDLLVWLSILTRVRNVTGPLTRVLWEYPDRGRWLVEEEARQKSLRSMLSSLISPLALRLAFNVGRDRLLGANETGALWFTGRIERFRSLIESGISTYRRYMPLAWEPYFLESREYVNGLSAATRRDNEPVFTEMQARRARVTKQFLALHRAGNGVADSDEPAASHADLVRLMMYQANLSGNVFVELFEYIVQYIEAQCRSPKALLSHLRQDSYQLHTDRLMNALMIFSAFDLFDHPEHATAAMSTLLNPTQFRGIHTGRPSKFQNQVMSKLFTYDQSGRLAELNPALAKHADSPSAGLFRQYLDFMHTLLYKPQNLPNARAWFAADASTAPAVWTTMQAVLARRVGVEVYQRLLSAKLVRDMCANPTEPVENSTAAVWIVAQQSNLPEHAGQVRYGYRPSEQNNLLVFKPNEASSYPHNSPEQHFVTLSQAYNHYHPTKPEFLQADARRVVRCGLASDLVLIMTHKRGLHCQPGQERQDRFVQVLQCIEEADNLNMTDSCLDTIATALYLVTDRLGGSNWDRAEAFVLENYKARLMARDVRRFKLIYKKRPPSDVSRVVCFPSFNWVGMTRKDFLANNPAPRLLAVLKHMLQHDFVSLHDIDFQKLLEYFWAQGDRENLRAVLDVALDYAENKDPKTPLQLNWYEHTGRNARMARRALALHVVLRYGTAKQIERAALLIDFNMLDVATMFLFQPGKRLQSPRVERYGRSRDYKLNAPFRLADPANSFEHSAGFRMRSGERPILAYTLAGELTHSTLDRKQGVRPRDYSAKGREQRLQALAYLTSFIDIHALLVDKHVELSETGRGDYQAKVASWIDFLKLAQTVRFSDASNMGQAMAKRLGALVLKIKRQYRAGRFTRALDRLLNVAVCNAERFEDLLDAYSATLNRQAALRGEEGSKIADMVARAAFKSKIQLSQHITDQLKSIDMAGESRADAEVRVALDQNPFLAAFHEIHQLNSDAQGKLARHFRDIAWLPFSNAIDNADESFDDTSAVDSNARGTANIQQIGLKIGSFLSTRMSMTYRMPALYLEALRALQTLIDTRPEQALRFFQVAQARFASENTQGNAIAKWILGERDPTLPVPVQDDVLDGGGSDSDSEIDEADIDSPDESSQKRRASAALVSTLGVHAVPRGGEHDPSDSLEEKESDVTPAPLDSRPG